MERLMGRRRGAVVGGAGMAAPGTEILRLTDDCELMLKEFDIDAMTNLMVYEMFCTVFGERHWVDMKPCYSL
jgi:hypothetical protein